MELPLPNQSYTISATGVSDVRLINFFATPVQKVVESDPGHALLTTPGKKLLNDLSGVEFRALVNLNDILYGVVDDIVYKLTPDENDIFTSSVIGTITTSSSGWLGVAASKTQIMLVDGTATGGWIITQATDTLTQITDEDFAGASSVAYMDGYFLYSTPDSQQLFATAINDGTSINALDTVEAEGHPDNIVGLVVDKRELWVFGEHTIEVFWDSAEAEGFPFSRRDGAFIDIGCGARGSIQQFDNSIMWLDSRGFICRANGYNPEVVSTAALTSAIKSYSRTDDAIAWIDSDRGSLFYNISFPSAKKTWSYDPSTKFIHERAYWNPDGKFEHDLINCQCFYKNKSIVGLRNSGKMCEVDSDTFTDVGDPIHRVIQTHHFQENLVQLSLTNLELQIDTGFSAPTDDEGYVMIRYSNDKGHRWSHEIHRSLGNTGDYNKPVRVGRVGSARHWMFNYRFVVPYKFAVIRANVDVAGDQ